MNDAPRETRSGGSASSRAAAFPVGFVALAASLASPALAEECPDFALYFGPRASTEPYAAPAEGEFPIVSRNASPLLGFQLGVKRTNAAGATTWEFSSQLGRDGGRLVKPVFVDDGGRRIDPATPNRATAPLARVIAARRGAALERLEAEDDFFSYDLAPGTGGPGFTAGYVADFHAVVTIPPTPTEAACGVNELLVLSIEPLRAAGGLDRLRGGDGASLAEGAAFTEARAAFAAEAPDLALLSTDRITEEFLEPLELFVLPTASSDGGGILPLDPDELEALYHWVASGGSLLVLLDDADIAGITAEQVLERFGLAAGVGLAGRQSARVTDRAHPLGCVASFSQHDPGWIARVGEAKTIASNDGGVALAVLEEGALSDVSGRVVFSSDANSFWSETPAHAGLFGENQELFGCIVRYLLGYERPEITRPTVHSIDARSSLPGTPVVLHGDGFGTAPGVVYEGEERAVVLEWTPTRIVVEKPSGTLAGAFRVETAAGDSSEARSYSLPAELDGLAVSIAARLLARRANPCGRPEPEEPPAAGIDLRVHEGEIVEFTAEVETDTRCAIEVELWHFGEEPVLERGRVVTHAFARQGVYEVRFVAGDQCPLETTYRGRTASASLTIEVLNSGPSADFFWEPASPTTCEDVCFTGQYTDCSPPAEAHSFSWDLGDGTHLDPPGVGQEVCHRYAADGTYEVSFTVTDASGAKISAERTVVVANDQPVARISVASGVPIAGEPVSFEGSFRDRCDPAGGGYRGEWNFGDGTPAVEGSSVEHVYAACGQYEVAYSVTDSGGASGTARLRLPVDARPVARFDAPAQSEEGRQVTLDASASSDACFGIESYYWVFGDGEEEVVRGVREAPPSPLASHVYAGDGLYTARLQVEDSAGLTSTVTREIRVENVAPEVLDIERSSPCAGDLTTISASVWDPSPGDRRGLAYEWTFDCGGEVSTASTPSVTRRFGECRLEVTLRVTDPDGAPSGVFRESFDFTPCVVTAMADCAEGAREGEEVLLSAGSSVATGGPIVRYRWDLGDGEEAVGPVVRHAYCQDGTYFVSLTVEDEWGHVADTTCALAVANAPPAADAGADLHACLGEAVTLSGRAIDPGCDALRYTWVLPDGTRREGQVLQTSCGAEGDSEVTLEVSDGRATSTDRLSLTCEAADSPACLSPVAACGGPKPPEPLEGDLVRFSGEGTDPGGGPLAAYRWDFGDGETTGWRPVTTGDLAAAHRYRDDGAYRVRLEVRNRFGRADTCDLDLTVSNAPPLVDAGPDREGMAGAALTFRGSFDDPGADDIHTFRWDFGDGGTADTLEAAHVFSVEGSYVATLTVFDDDGASGSDSASVEVGPRPPAVALWPPTVTVSSCLGEGSSRLSVTNPTGSDDVVRLELEGLAAGRFELERTEVLLAPGARAVVALRLLAGACADNAGLYDFTLSATSARSGLLGLARGRLRVVDSPIPLESTVSPSDGALLGASTVTISWRTVAPATTVLHYRAAREGETFTRVDVPGAPSLLHEVELSGLELGESYQWYGESTCCDGAARAWTRRRTFSIEKGVSIETAPGACVTPDFRACLDVFLTNEDPLDHVVRPSVRGSSPELGSIAFSEREVAIPAGQTRAVELCVDARRGLAGETYGVDVRVSLAGGGRVSEARVPVLICVPPPAHYAFTCQEVERDEYTLVNTYRLVNLGAPLTALEGGEVVVEAGEGFEPGELSFLDGTRFSLGSEPALFRVQYVGAGVGDRDGRLVARAEARGLDCELATHFGCPGNARAYSVELAGTALCRRVVDWYTGDLEDGRRAIPFDLPEGFARGDISSTPGEAPVLYLDFELPFEPEVYPEHSVTVELNGKDLSPLLHGIVPVGTYAFPLDPAGLLLPAEGEGVARNEVVLHVEAPGDRPFLTALDARVEVPLTRFAARVCGTSEADARRRLEGAAGIGRCDLAGLELVPRIASVRILDREEGEERASFCLESSREAAFRVEVYNPSWALRSALLEYEIAALPARAASVVAAGVFPPEGLEPFAARSYRWPWDIPRADEGLDYGLRLELRDGVSDACLDCRAERWRVRGDVPGFAIEPHPEELFLRSGETSFYLLDVAARCGFAEDVCLEVLQAPPLISAEASPACVAAPGRARLTVRAEPGALVGRHYLRLGATGGGRSEVVDLPLSVSEARGADLVIGKIEVRAEGRLPGWVNEGESAQIDLVFSNAGDVAYRGRTERVLFYEEDSLLRRFVQSDLLPIDVPPLAPGATWTYTDEQVFPLPNNEGASYEILADFPEFEFDNDLDDNKTAVTAEILPDPEPFVRCAVSLVFAIYGAPWAAETVNALVSKELFVSFKMVWKTKALVAAVKRKDIVGVMRSGMTAVLYVAIKTLHDPLLKKTKGVFNGVMTALDCAGPFLTILRGAKNSLGTLLDVADHTILPELREASLDAYAVMAASPVDLVVEDEAGRRSIVRADGTVECGIPDSVCQAFSVGAAEENPGKLVFLTASQPPRVTLLGAGEGTAKVSFFHTRAGEGLDLVAEFPEIEVTGALQVEGTFDGEGRLELDREGDGVLDEVVEPEEIRAREIGAPLLLAGFLGTGAPGGGKPLPLRVGIPFSQVLHAARYQEGDLDFELVDGPEGMVLDRRTGELTWTPEREDIGTRDVVVRVTGPGGESDVELYRPEVSNAPLVSLSVTPSEISSTVAGSTRRLRVTGSYADGSSADLTPAAAGTTYESSDETVARVSPGGVVEIAAGGEAIVTVHHGALEAQVRVLLGFRRGDANGVDTVNITDAIYLLSFLFLGGPEPNCQDAADTDDSGSLNITDAVKILNWLFLTREPLAPPGPKECGLDPTPDDLPPCRYENCEKA